MAYDKVAKAAADKARYLRQTEADRERTRERQRHRRAADPETVGLHVAVGRERSGNT